MNEQKGLKSTISTFKIEELHEEILSLKSEVKVVTLEKDSMIDTLKQQLEKEVKSKNKLLQRFIQAKHDIESLISLTRNKLLSKYNIFEEVDELNVLNDTKNKSIDEVLQNESKAIVPTNSLALFPLHLLDDEEAKSAVIDPV